MPGFDILLQLLMALGIGLLIGIERGWKLRQLGEGERVAGVRTFSLIGLLGGLSAYVAGLIGPWVIFISTAGVFLFVLSVYLARFKKVEDKGATTEVAAILTFFLGVLAVLGEPLVVVAMTILMLAVLGLKAPFHRALEKLNKNEIISFFQMVVLSVLVLPFLPNQGFGPGGVLNPFEIWLMVVLIQGISFFGHFAVRWWGSRAGTLLMGIFGGLASTTALTFTAARLARGKDAHPDLLAASVSAGNAVMFIRTLVIVSAINLSLAPVMAIPLIMGCLGALAGAVLMQKKAAGAGSKKLKKQSTISTAPANLVPAFSFALLLVGVLVLTYYAEAYLADKGVIALAALSGLLDVDAIAISLSKMAGSEAAGILGNVFLVGIFTAIVANSLAKTAIAFFLGTKAFGAKIAAIFGYALAGAGLGLLISLL